MKKKTKSSRPIHPFPARMAPDLAFEKLRKVSKRAVVLDPMAGSGTVLRQAIDLGLRARGFDLDPLAVLMSKVWTTPVKDSAIERCLLKTLKTERRLRSSSILLPWIDKDAETKAFIDYWFARPQKRDLRRLSYVLMKLDAASGNRDLAAINVLKIAFSRLIITKESGASLARDVSHSRPHKVAEASDYRVMPEFVRSVNQLRSQLRSSPPKGNCKVSSGDARSLKIVKADSVDVVMTSPPYLNAIDYMRGHRLSLVWLGYSLCDLRKIRSDSIGAERGPEREGAENEAEEIKIAMGKISKLPNRHKKMIYRYVNDIKEMMSEIARVLRPKGRAVLVVGNSCLKNVFIKNADGIIKAGTQAGLRLFARTERELPDTKRYLPMPIQRGEALGKRMRTETILTFGIR
jgi:SAM-dependent methyltransferase